MQVVELLPPGTETPLFQGEFARNMKNQEATDPAEVVRQAIAGIESGKEEIRPQINEGVGDDEPDGSRFHDGGHGNEVHTKAVIR